MSCCRLLGLLMGRICWSPNRKIFAWQNILWDWRLPYHFEICHVVNWHVQFMDFTYDNKLKLYKPESLVCKQNRSQSCFPVLLTLLIIDSIISRNEDEDELGTTSSSCSSADFTPRSFTTVCVDFSELNPIIFQSRRLQTSPQWSNVSKRLVEQLARCHLKHRPNFLTPVNAIPDVFSKSFLDFWKRKRCWVDHVNGRTVSIYSNSEYNTLHSIWLNENEKYGEAISIVLCIRFSDLSKRSQSFAYSGIQSIERHVIAILQSMERWYLNM